MLVDIMPTLYLFGFMLVSISAAIWGVIGWRLFQEWRERRRVLTKSHLVVKGWPVVMTKHKDKTI